IIMAQQQHAADVHPNELCPPNKRYDLMDANKKVELEHVQCLLESKILMNIIKNHPCARDAYHNLQDDDIMKNIFNSGRNKNKVGMRIPAWMITDEMKLTEHYKMYAEVFGLDVPLTRSQPTESTQGTHRTPSAPWSPNPATETAESMPLAEKADEMILQDKIQVSLAEHKIREEQEARENVALVYEHLAAEEIEKLVEDSENVDDSSPPWHDDTSIPGTRLEPRSDKESLEVEIVQDTEVEPDKDTPMVDVSNIVPPVNVDDEEDEITDEVFELRRRVKGKNVEETRISPIPSPTRSHRNLSTLVSLDTEKLQELTDNPHNDAHPEGENSAKSQKTSEYEAYVSGESSSRQVNVEELGLSISGNQEQDDEFDFWTNSYASDDDEIPTKQVTQDIMEEISLIIDEAKLKKIADKMLRQRCTSGDEHQYHIDQMKNFLQSGIVWESRKEIQVLRRLFCHFINFQQLSSMMMILKNRLPDGLIRIEEYDVFSIIYEPVHGIIYTNSKKEKRVMRHSEIHKFCDATLRRTLEGLKSYYNDVKYGYVQKELTNDEVEFLKLFEEDIEVQLNYRDQMRRWEIPRWNAIIATEEVILLGSAGHPEFRKAGTRRLQRRTILVPIEETTAKAMVLQVFKSDPELTDENHVWLKVPRKDNMYYVDLGSIVPQGGLTYLFAKATLDESNLWHRRLGHINFKTINKLVRGNLVRGLPSKIFENHTCVACQKGKQHKSSSTKDETSGILKTFITGIENQINHRVKIIRCDNGTEFKNKEMNQFYEMKGIKREFSVARTLQQNRVAERKNRTLIEAAKTMLADSKLLTTFWAEAVNTACYVQNRVLVITPHNKIPYELFLGRKHALSFMRLFGCLVTIINTLDHLGTKENVDAGQAGKKEVPGKDYILLPLWTQDSPNSSNSKDSPDAGFKPSGEEEKKDEINDAGIENDVVNENIISGCADDPNIPFLEGIYYSNDDEYVGVEADMTNLDTHIPFSPIPTTKLNKDHPLSQIIKDIMTPPQTRRMTRIRLNMVCLFSTTEDQS
ncbi:putative ribonuclease H-like domain-containing protein, partial [Tanacetum coccineum]